MFNDTIKNKLATLGALEDTNDKIVELSDGVYAFLGSAGKVRLINLDTMQVMDESYNIRYVSDTVFVGYVKDPNNMFSPGETTVISLKTYNKIMTMHNLLVASTDLLYADPQGIFNKELRPLTIYNMGGKQLYQTYVGYGTHLKRLGNTNVYLLQYKFDGVTNYDSTKSEIKEYGEILVYNKKKESVHKVLTIKKPIIDAISSTRVIITNVDATGKLKDNHEIIDMIKIEYGDTEEIDKLRRYVGMQTQ